MFPLLLSLAWALTVGGLLLRAIGQFRRYEVIRPEPALTAEEAPLILVVVPARNEAANIERCLRALLAQHYPAHRMAVAVVNDNSTDATAALAQRIAAGHRQVTVLNGDPLPAGWTGKPFACWQGAARQSSDWLAFIDADTFAGPFLLGTAVQLARRRRIDMLSLEPFQVLGSFWERLVIPSGLLALAFTQDLTRVNNPALPDAVANGQFLLIRSSVYAALGGHAGVRGEICEDTALARAVKHSGHRLAVLGAGSLIQTRMYDGLQSLWEGLSKNVTEMLGGIAATIAITLFGLLIAGTCVLLPIWFGMLCFAPRASRLEFTAFGLALAASGALWGIHIGTARYLRIPFWYGLLFPFGYLLAALIALNGIRERWQGHVLWKGRVFAPPSGGLSLK
jgi:chlorobactene glucosyltransferase